jgi:hypothetical protein
MRTSNPPKESLAISFSFVFSYRPLHRPLVAPYPTRLELPAYFDEENFF